MIYYIVAEFNAKLSTMNEPSTMDAFENSVGRAMDKVRTSEDAAKLLQAKRRAGNKMSNTHDLTQSLPSLRSSQLEKHMEKGNLRVEDLFRKVDKDGGGEIDSAEMKAFFVELAQPSKANLARAKKAAERKGESKPVPEEDPDTSNAPSAEDLANLMAFLDPDENGITKEELMAGFRDGRRARANAVVEAKGKRIMKAIVKKISDKGKSLSEWFDSVNTSRTLPGSEPVIDDRELKKGIKKLKIKMSAKNVYELLRFVDPDGDGDISKGEFQQGEIENGEE